jgi:hypothetical protein
MTLPIKDTKEIVIEGETYTALVADVVSASISAIQLFYDRERCRILTGFFPLPTTCVEKRNAFDAAR